MCIQFVFLFDLQVRLMISDTARHKLIVLSGQCYENTGELILQSGSFSFFNFIDIFTDQEVRQKEDFNIHFSVDSFYQVHTNDII